MRLSLYLLSLALLGCGSLLGQSRPESSSSKLPNVTVDSVMFSNVTQLSTAEQEKIASDLKSRRYHGPNWIDEFDERVRDAWQKRGYFEAHAHSNSHAKNDDLNDQEVDVSTDVDEGVKYLLADIEWLGPQTFPNDQLDAAMPLKRLQTFDTGKVRIGMEHLRRLYASKGYVRFFSIPDTKLDNAAHTVTLMFELQPGEVYHVESVEFSGGTPRQRKAVEQQWPLHPGDPFDPEAIRKFFKEHAALLPSYVSIADNVEQDLDEKEHTVKLKVHLERR